MLNYISSDHFKTWQKNKNWQYVKYAVYANFLHIILLLLGYKRLISLLLVFQRKNSRYLLADTKAAKILKKQINPIFKRIKNSKYHWSNCFSSSILLWHVLKNQGLDTQLIIGASKVNQEFKAHAWVEYNSIPLNENKKVRTRFHAFEHDFSSINNISSLKN